jgi:hypothetical protein
MKALRELYAKERTALALAIHNGPNITELLELLLLSEVMVWRENKGWFGPYRLLSNDSYNIIIETHDGPKTFRSMYVKPYHRDEQTENPAQDSVDPGEHPKDPSPLATNEPPRRRGRPRGSKNKPKVYVQYTARPVGLYANYVTRKEQEALELARKLRREGVITTPGAPFEASTKAEIEQLIKAGVFEFIRFGREVQSSQLFKAHIINKIKGQNIKPYEKSRLVVQGYNNSGKETVLTQSPTIQRCSQRLILALALSLIQAGNHILTGRDITQAYPQSEINL